MVKNIFNVSSTASPTVSTTGVPDVSKAYVDAAISAVYATVGAPVAGPGVAVSGTTVSTKVDNQTLGVGAAGLYVKSVGTVQLLPASVTANKVATITAGQVTGKLVDAQLDTVSASKVVGVLNAKVASVSGSKLVAGTVGTSVLADGSVTDAKVASVSGSKLVAGTVGTAALIDLAVTDAKVASVSGSKLVAGTIGTGALADGAVSNAKLAAGIDGSKLAAGTVGTSVLADAAVTNAKLATGIDGAKLNVGSIGSSHLAAGAVTDAKVTDVSAVKLTGILDPARIADGTLTNAKLASGIDSAKLAGTIDLAQLPDVSAKVTAVSAASVAGTLPQSTLGLGAAFAFAMTTGSKIIGGTALTGPATFAFQSTAGAFTSVINGCVKPPVSGYYLVHAKGYYANGALPGAHTVNFALYNMTDMIAVSLVTGCRAEGNVQFLQFSSIEYLDAAKSYSFIWIPLVAIANNCQVIIQSYWTLL
ncbi:hypothetical protein H9P43_007335 [Blastocladiella emersonii ATCC 22665]|nr:hypothetical protein H9P43_007335 [Blastocladiella emersonii ATCC 22665]